MPMPTQDQILLEALHDFILPHIGHSLDSNRNQEQIFSSPKSVNLITALKEFISSIVGNPTPTDAGNLVAVKLGEVDHDSSKNISSGGEINKRAEGTLTLQKCLLNPNEGPNDEVHEDTLPIAETTVTFHNKVLSALYRRVFNKMPIRLLRFVPEDGDLKISLIERSAIYEHLATLLDTIKDHSDYSPLELISESSSRSPKTETEEQAIHRIIKKYATYGILSHTWLRVSPEVTYNTWNTAIFDAQGPGYHKLVNFCKYAWKDHGLTLGWMDTVCINKDSSSELDESIRSMYDWYKRAKVCLIYLAKTETLLDIRHDPWFTRGWTLQELLAPTFVKFYNMHWTRFVDEDQTDKTNTIMAEQITLATTILPDEINRIRWIPFSRRMQLAALRNVTREEDTAYSLMGICDVSISTAYGEGSERAFSRLLNEILNSKSYGVMDLFNWASDIVNRSVSDILPSSPQHYLYRSSAIDLETVQLIEPLTLTHMGLRIPVLLMPGVSIDTVNPEFNPCNPVGEYGATATISPAGMFAYIPTTYRLLESVMGFDGKQDSGRYKYTFAVFNVNQSSRGIFISKKCAAILLCCFEEGPGDVRSTGRFDRVYTRELVIFDMEQRNPEQTDKSARDYMVPMNQGITLTREELRMHGM